MAAGDQEAESRAAAAAGAESPEALVRSMALIALARGIDLGEPQARSGWDASAEIGTDRGKVVVSPRTEGTFQVRILHRGFAWSQGWTNDLAEVVEVADLWRRGGLLRELHDRFPFMSWDELAQAFEDGDPAPTKWGQLLSSDWHLPDRPLLQAAHAHSDLRVFYPDISHRSLMLTREPCDLESGLVKITPLSAGHYQVITFPVAFRREVDSLSEALEVAAACCRSLSDS